MLASLGRIAPVALVLTGLLASPAPAAQVTSLGTNLVQVSDFSGAVPFSNLMKQAVRFCSQRIGDDFCAGKPIKFDANGYPRALPRNHFARGNVMSDSALLPAGNYVATWKGKGAIAIPYGVATVVSKEARSVTFEITPTSEVPIEINITKTNPDNHLRDLRLVLPGAGDGSRTAMFNPEYLELLAPYDSLRFMDWGVTNSNKIVSYSDRTKAANFTYATGRGVPIEIMIDLANTLQVDPWFNVPTLAGDDYITGMAEMINRCLSPNLVPSVEYSNETWNSTFRQFDIVQRRGEDLGLGDGDPFVAGLQYTAHRSLEVWDIWDSVFGQRAYRRVLASQAANPFTGETQLAYQRAEGEPTAGDRADAYAIAPYFTVPGLDEPERLDEMRNLTVDELLDRAEADVAGRTRDDLIANMTMVDTFGVELVAYEGGQHLVGAAGNQDDEQLTNNLIAANRADRMEGIYTDYLNLWSTEVAGQFNHFNDVTMPSRSGSWGSVEYLGQDPADAPKLRALLAFAAQVNGPAHIPVVITPCK
jgi:hypothetical protein